MQGTHTVACRYILKAYLPGGGGEEGCQMCTQSWWHPGVPPALILLG